MTYTQQDLNRLVREAEKLAALYEHQRDASAYESKAYWEWHDKAVFVNEFIRLVSGEKFGPKVDSASVQEWARLFTIPV